jgi:hypothetical protein
MQIFADEIRRVDDGADDVTDLALTARSGNVYR